ncbi:pyridoxal-phosphate dependent enzyme [Myxococcota bacterium]|nr:pyridoxal-phosphate dependent enzyme [Myxococcota bacterium]
MILRCEGCGARVEAGPLEPFPFRCPQASARPEVDHVLAPVLEAHVPWPRSDDAHPFKAWRALSHSHAMARRFAMKDEDYLALVDDLDRAISAVYGHGFSDAPLRHSAALSARTQTELSLVSEVEQVAGSHKARHLMGLAIHLEIVERLGWAEIPDLAIASCGNAALAAAVVAKAAGRRLRVFIPTDADPSIVERLRALEAEINVSPRCVGERSSPLSEPAVHFAHALPPQSGDIPCGEAGDPCIHRFREALAEGALPFCCQGSENGLTLEGAQTLAYRLAASMPEPPDHLFVQVGGGALASAVGRGIFEAVRRGVWSRAPRIHMVQTQGAAPLARAYERLRVKIDELGVEAALAHAATHRAAYMWPWEETPHSVAHGILDDETYDWLGCVRAMAYSGGLAVVVDEETLIEARRLVEAEAGLDASATGTASLAGLLHLRASGLVQPGERVCCLITGRASPR